MARGSTEPSGELGEDLSQHPPAASTYQLKVLLSRKQRGEGGTRGEAMRARMPRNGRLGWSMDRTVGTLGWGTNPFVLRGTRERSPQAPSGPGAAEQWGESFLTAAETLPEQLPTVSGPNIRSEGI